MARIAFTPSAYADITGILTYLREESGRFTAMKYDLQFEHHLDRLADFPDSGAARSCLGRGIRIGIVAPYLVIYRYTAAADTVTVLRVVDGRRELSGTLLKR